MGEMAEVVGELGRNWSLYAELSTGLDSLRVGSN